MDPRTLFCLSIGAATILASAVAGASPSFPADIAQHLGVTCQPACTVCHNNPNGGVGTATTPFAQNMVMFGLVAENANSLYAALDKDKAEGTESAGGGETDIEALMACMDPNQPYLGDAGGDAAPVVFATDPIPEYGCAVGPATGEGGGAGAAAIASFAGALVLRRGRRRSAG
jgi:hypothetical protein